MMFVNEYINLKLKKYTPKNWAKKYDNMTQRKN